MAKFYYTATQSDGKVIKGMVEAEDQSEALGLLVQNDLRPISIKKALWKSFTNKNIGFGSSISSSDKIFLTKYLALMLKAGTNLFSALDILIADFKKPSVKYLLIEIKNNLEKGQPFYTTFSKYPQYFSPIFINLIKAGEISGNLETTFENLSVMLIKEEDLRRRIRSALAYPGILLIASVTILFFLVTFALPRIAEVFLSGGLEPPLFSRVVFSVGLFIAQYVWILGSVILVSSLVLFYFFFKTKIGRKILFRFLNYVPIVNTVIERIAIQRFALTLGHLIRAGLPIIDSLELTAIAVGHDNMEMSLKRIAHEGVARGLTIGEAFRKESSFPLVITNLVAVSERAGHLDEILFILSTFYESEIDASIKVLVSVIEPAMLIVIGGIVGTIAMSVIVPIYQLVGQF